MKRTTHTQQILSPLAQELCDRIANAKTTGDAREALADAMVHFAEGQIDIVGMEAVNRTMEKANKLVLEILRIAARELALGSKK